MSKFTIEYEDLKKILAVFYNSPYRNVAVYVDMLHNLKEEDGSLNLREKIDLENALNAQIGVKPE